jgi:biotin carboxyl carrier protein
MAAMNGQLGSGPGRLVRVTPAPASRLPGDEPRDVDPSAVAAGQAARGIVGQDRPASPARPRTIEVVVDGWRFELEVEDPAHAALRVRATRARVHGSGNGPFEVRAMIPGRVAGVAVTVGDAVTAGQTLVVVEAMKMQNELRAPRDGTVERVSVGVGETIDLGDLLVVLT